MSQDDKKHAELSKQFLAMLSQEDRWFEDSDEVPAELLELYGRGEALTLDDLKKRVNSITMRMPQPQNDSGWGIAARDGGKISDDVLSTMARDRDREQESRNSSTGLDNDE